MRLTHQILGRLLLILTTLAVLPAWAQTAGRVLVASGEVSLLRGSASQPATAGMTLEKGDRVRTGAAGTAQLWFTDSTVVALRSGSDFLIEQYEYRGNKAGELVFSLLRGGFRTVAGFIGAEDPKQYRVKTPIATVGRRGTQYGLIYCAQDCPLPAGGVAPDGLYGGVYDGRVSVGNNTPERLFGRDEYFYVAGIDSIPTPLLGPPTFFADRLQGLARNAQKPGSEPAASPAARDEAAPPDPAPVLAQATGFAVLENRDASGNLKVGVSTAPTAVFLAHSLLQTNGRPAPYGGAAVVTGNLLRITGSGSARALIGYDFNPAGFPNQGSLGNGTLTMQGHDAASGATWGRWSGGTVLRVDSNVQTGPQTPGTGLHYLLATPYDPVALAAKTGQFSFSDIGGTTPTSSAGETASSFSVGPAIIDFTQRTGTLTSLSLVFPTSQWSYSNVGFQLLNPNAPAQIHTAAPNSGSCAGTACGPGQGTNSASLDLHGLFIGNGSTFGLTLQGRSGGTSPNAAFGAVRIFGNPQPYTPPPQPPLALVFAGSMQETNGSRASYGGAAIVPVANLTTSGTGPNQLLTAFNIAQATFSGAAGASVIDMAGYDALSGVYYGRWATGSLTSGANQQPGLAPGTQTSGMGVHYLYGSPTPDSVIAAKTGTFQYVDYVGTQPTASNGESVNSFSIGPIDINFTTRTGEIQSVYAQFPNSEWYFSSLNFNLIATPGQGASFSGNLPNSGGCYGTACGPVQGSNSARADFEGRFIGPSGNFLGLTFHGNSGGNMPSGNPNLTFGMVRLFKCPTCP
jgi:FecR protein